MDGDLTDGDLTDEGTTDGDVTGGDVTGRHAAEDPGRPAGPSRGPGDRHHRAGGTANGPFGIDIGPEPTGSPDPRPQHGHVRAGSTANGPFTVDLGSELAGLSHSRLRVLELPPGRSHSFGTGDCEWIVLPLEGGCTVHTAGEDFELSGRNGVFSGVTDFAYLPRDARARITSAVGGRFALAGAVCARRLPARYGPAAEVPVELRGAGNCSRQVNNFAAAEAFVCDRLIAVEVLTPGGNWSSYPPHKHDEYHPGAESELEEIYYFEIEREGLGYHRVSPSRRRGTDLLAEVRTGDSVLVPDGWHGPCIAAPGHDMYYLNVMAGPGETREWLIRDHPEHSWIRDTWPTPAPDPRLPLYGPPPQRPPLNRPAPHQAEEGPR